MTRTPERYAEFGKFYRGEILIRTGYNETPHDTHISIPIYKEIAFWDGGLFRARQSARS
jgi:hypothetical protein